MIEASFVQQLTDISVSIEGCVVEAENLCQTLQVGM
jgi:hypothetical protein